MENLRLCARSDRPKSVVPVGPLRFGESFVVIAGPCSVENERQLLTTARLVKKDKKLLFCCAVRMIS